MLVHNCWLNIPPVPRGLTARISGFHPGGPGSTPGVGIHFILQTRLMSLFSHLFSKSMSQ